MKPNSVSFSLILVLLVLPMSTVANQDNLIEIKRSACANDSVECHSRYTFSDVSEFVKTFEQHPNAIPSRAILKSDIRLGPSNLLRRDVIHFNSKGELIEIWSRYRRKISGIGVRHKTAYPIHANGAIVSTQLGLAQFIDGRFYPRQAKISFDEYGRVLKDDFYPELSDDHNVETSFNKALHTIDEAIEFAEFSVPKNTQITVNTQGKISSVKLRNGLWLGESYYPTNTSFIVNSDGRVEDNDLYSRLAMNDEIKMGIQSYAQLLKEPLILGALVLPAGTLVERNAYSITAAHLLEKTDVCGFTKQGDSVWFQAYGNGSYSFSFRFKQDIEIQGLVLTQAERHVHFHDNCSLKKATLSTTKTVNGFPLAAGEQFELDATGNVIGGTLGAPHAINDIKISAGTVISLDPLYSVGLMLFRGGIVTHGDREYKSDFMQIYKHGVIAWGQLNKPAVIDGQTYPAATTLEFKPSGELLEFNLP